MKQFMCLLILFLGSAWAQGTLGGAFERLAVDTSRSNIPVAEVLSGGPPPQGIPALGFTGDWQEVASASEPPTFVSQEDAAAWLSEEEPVIVLSLAEDARIYPLQILTWHEIVNDTLGGVPIAVTFCPLCNSALAFDRRIPLGEEALGRVQAVNPEVETVALDSTFTNAYAAQEGEDAEVTAGVEVTFGVSGLLYNSNLLMFDTQTSTLWSQILGEGNIGALTDTALLRLPAQIVSFAQAKEAFPNASVLSQDTGYRRSYGQNPYVGYDAVGSPAFLFQGVTDGRLTPKARVASVVQGEETAAYPFEVLSQEHVINDEINGVPLTVFWQAGTASALDSASIAEGQDVGAVGVFDRRLGNRELTFEWRGDAFVDAETNSTWNLLGKATRGELEGERLSPIVHDNTLWFAWAAFKPETRVYLGE